MRAEPDAKSTEPTAPLTVLLVDDRPLMRVGLASVLASDSQVGEVLEASSFEAAFALLSAHEPDVVIVCCENADAIGSNDLLCSLAAQAGRARIVCLFRDGSAAPPACGRFTPLPETVTSEHMLDVIDHPSTQPMSCAGAQCGWRHTHVAVNPALTAQESRVLAALADGQSNREIAHSLGLAEKTVKNYVTRIFSKLAVTSRTAAIASLRKDISGALHH